MNGDDNIEFVPGSAPTPTDTEDSSAPSTQPTGDREPEIGSPKIFDFSSDLNISVIKDGEKAQTSSMSIPNPILKATISRPTPPVIPAPQKSTPPTPPKKINQLDGLPPENLPGAVEENAHEWPFASAQTQKERTLAVQNKNQATTDEKAEEATPVSPSQQEHIDLKEIASSQKQKILETAYENPATPKTSAGGIKNLRTYESDVAEILAARGTSKVAISLAESKRKGEGETIKNTPPEPKRAKDLLQSTETTSSSGGFGSKIILVLISIILIGLGSIVGYYLYNKSALVASKTPAVVKATLLPALVPANSQLTLSVDGMNSATLYSAIKNQLAKTQPSSTIRELILIEKKGDIEYRVSAPEMIALMGIKIPDIISRTLTPQWMLGTYTDGEGKHPFVIVTTNLFQNAFAGMLAWEPDMTTDLKNYLPFASSTLTAEFRDEIVRNKDVRALVTKEGTTIFLYSLIDNTTMVIAENENTLNALLARLENKAFVR